MTQPDTSAIRRATPADVDAIMACERRPGYEDTVGRWSREEHLAAMADPTHLYLIGEDGGGSAAGFVMLQEIGSPSGAVLVRRVAMMAQGRGWGTLLLGRALAHVFDELGAARAWLRVWPQNERGLALYRKLGLREAGRSEIANDPRGSFMTIMSIDAASHDRNRSLLG